MSDKRQDDSAQHSDDTKDVRGFEERSATFEPRTDEGDRALGKEFPKTLEAIGRALVGGRGASLAQRMMDAFEVAAGPAHRTHALDIMADVFLRNAERVEDHPVNLRRIAELLMAPASRDVFNELPKDQHPKYSELVEISATLGDLSQNILTYSGLGLGERDEAFILPNVPTERPTPEAAVQQAEALTTQFGTMLITMAGLLNALPVLLAGISICPASDKFRGNYVDLEYEKMYMGPPPPNVTKEELDKMLFQVYLGVTVVEYLKPGGAIPHAGTMVKAMSGGIKSMHAAGRKRDNLLAAITHCAFYIDVKYKYYSKGTCWNSYIEVSETIRVTPPQTLKITVTNTGTNIDYWKPTDITSFLSNPLGDLNSDEIIDSINRSVQYALEDKHNLSWDLWKKY